MEKLPKSSFYLYTLKVFQNFTLWNAFRFSPSRMMFAVGVSYIAIIMLRVIALCPLSGEVLLQMGVEFCQQFFSAFIEMIMWLLFFSLLTWYIISIHLYWRKYTFPLMTTPKPLTVWITTNCGKFFFFFYFISFYLFIYLFLLVGG